MPYSRKGKAPVVLTEKNCCAVQKFINNKKQQIARRIFLMK
jgi:hypothetical protein